MKSQMLPGPLVHRSYQYMTQKSVNLLTQTPRNTRFVGVRHSVLLA